MRLALVFCVLTSCAPRPGPPKCVDPEAPAEDEFAACGGIAHHTGPGPNVPFVVRFKNEMGPSFELVSVCVLVDGYSLFAKDKREWSGELFRGKHVLKVRAEYKRRMSTGAYDYVNDLKVVIRSAAEIATTQQGEATIVAYEQGSATTPIEQRPALRWSKPKCE